MATGLAFAVRDVLMSFFAWMILLRKKPFRIGDYIRIGEDEGKAITHLLDRKDYVKVFADIRNEKLCLEVEYLVDFENKQMLRSDVIKLIFSKMNGLISVPKT